MKKLGILLFIITLNSVFVYGETFQELKPLDEQIKIEIKKPAEKVFEEVKKVDMNKKIETKEKSIQNMKKETQLEKINAQNILDLEQKKVKNGIVYAIGDNKPYTGSFGLFLGDFIEYKEDYVDGILNGDKIWYSDNGNIVLQEHYKNNKIYGDQKAYYENGNIKSIVKYKNNKIVAIVDYDENGKIIHEDNFKNGTGVWKYFWNNGKVSEVGKYKNWVKDGKWKKYNKDGEIDTITEYKNGRLVKEYWN